MADGATAADQLERLLHVLPAAARDGGAAPDALADALGVTPATLLRDLEAVTARAYYHPAAGAEDLQVTIEPGRIRVWTAGAFRRPVKLTPLESVALALGLRGRKLEGHAPADLLARVEAHLAVPGGEPLAERFHAPDLATDPAAVRATFHEGAARRRVALFRYLKPGRETPEDRTVHPWAVAHAEGSWYALGYSEEAGDVRAFRLDRVLDVRLGDEGRDPPADFDPALYLDGGRLFFTRDEPAEAVVRYSPRVARWIAERVEGRTREDGSLDVRHRVADADWLVRHVLQYGADAEVIEPAGLREAVRAAAARMAG